MADGERLILRECVCYLHLALVQGFFWSLNETLLQNIIQHLLRPLCNVSVKTSNWITENFKCPSPMVSKPKTPSVTDFLSYFIIYGYVQKLGTCFVPVNVHVNQYSDRI